MGYRGGPTPGGEQGPSFYYPGSHDGSQPWPSSFARADHPPRDFARVFSRRWNPPCLAGSLLVREFQLGPARRRITRARARVNGRTTATIFPPIFVPRERERERESESESESEHSGVNERASEHDVTDARDGKCEKCSITV